MTEDVSGCRINTHATYMMMMDVAPAYADLELEKWGCTYITPQPAVSILLKDGRSLSLYSDVEKSVASITKFSAKDAEIYREVYTEFEEMCDECLIPQTYRPAMPPLELLTMLNDKPLGQKILEISEKSPREIIEECGFETEALKARSYLTSMGDQPNTTGVGYLVPVYLLHAELVDRGPPVAFRDPQVLYRQRRRGHRNGRRGKRHHRKQEGRRDTDDEGP
jgi:phytoene dehydrogenase-like protein